jgi:hypothetical protein
MHFVMSVQLQRKMTDPQMLNLNSQDAGALRRKRTFFAVCANGQEESAHTKFREGHVADLHKILVICHILMQDTEEGDYRGGMGLSIEREWR